MRKLAIIRKDSEEGCPFGLSIPMGCQIAGEHIDKLAPLNILGPEASPEDKQKIIAANTRALTWLLMQDGSEPAKCKYVSMLFPQKDGVDCSWGDTAAGLGKGPDLQGQPAYSQMYSGIGMQGINSFPLGFLSDMNISRNLYMGLYSLQGSPARKIELLKLANDLLKERANKIASNEEDKA